eukprot:TRINITY_DN3407_c0_g1_i1.p1 TRINITY_DN3407_c0_g1~~TRINITY_DN3407_c0_g1_i1.p1  ORF type:complete len:160 (-),score=27.17 TRINITY_DN3407_c0_g1_i1:113-592(-)
MITYRQANAMDLPKLQHCNSVCLPENYTSQFHNYHFMTSPYTSWIAECDGVVVGYVMGKIEEIENSNKKKSEIRYSGHITSVAVELPYRNMGIGKQLMMLTLKTMTDIYDLDYCTLHVRASNTVAQEMYKGLGFEIYSRELKYYGNQETAFEMRCRFGH